MGCEHNLAEIDTAAHFDGLCPLCLKESLARRDALLREVVPAFQSALKLFEADGRLWPACQQVLEPLLNRIQRELGEGK